MNGFANLFSRMNVQRYVYALDLVPMAPDDLFLSYRHVGKTNKHSRSALPPELGLTIPGWISTSPETRMIGNTGDQRRGSGYESCSLPCFATGPQSAGGRACPQLSQR